MKTFILPLLLTGVLLSRAIAADPLEIAKDYVYTHLNEWNLSPQDVDGMTVSKLYTDQSSGITRVYFRQRYRGIPVNSAILNVCIDKEGQVFFAGCRFVPDLAGKVNAVAPALSPAEAVSRLVVHLGLPVEELRLQNQTESAPFVFEKGKIAREDITVMLCLQPHEGKVLLAWDILLAPIGKPDKWSTRVDALSGVVLNEFNWTVYCQAPGRPFSRETGACSTQCRSGTAELVPLLTGAQYNVWPAPFESPNHGPRTLVTDPADPLASPYGWHDTNGQPGAEYTITRGNNAHAFQDRNDYNVSYGDEPDGGANLHFDFPYDPDWEPVQYIDASVVNLFYWINYIHDFAYHFGFDEAAGNFQENNYGRGGAGNDPMIGHTQAAANLGYVNNPFYIHGKEGESGHLYIEEFARLPNYLTVNVPPVLAGQYVTSIAAPGWGAGAYVTNVPVSGEVALLQDGIEEPLATDGCEEIINKQELAGKIAFIDRGGCEYGYKAWQAQKAGAIGVIICNYNNEYIGDLYRGDYGAKVQIPIVLITAISGQAMRQYIGQGLKVSLVNPGLGGPANYDIGLDNGFIVHEYGHGITWRLAGEPDVSCVYNAEHMDEGFSDFFAMATTVRPGDTGAGKRGIGTYVYDEPTTGRGNRRYYYSTDMSISPLTYGDVANGQERHDVGEVWTAMTWDMYWAFVDKYGWSADPYQEWSGNYKAIRLVFECLKNLPCSAGFVDARDAILAADEVLFSGENICLIWEVFARRGLGYSADQGSPFDAGDQKEAFDLPPLCANSIILEKSVTGFIQPGNDIAVSLKVGNYKRESATNVTLTDAIPAGTTFKPGSGSLPALVQGNTLSFGLGTMNPGEEITVTYTLESAHNAWSKRFFLDDVPDTNNVNWHVYSVGIGASEEWLITGNLPAHSGNFSWNAVETIELSRQILELNPDRFTFHVTGEHPALRFFHRYQTRAGLNGGILEVRETGSATWNQAAGAMLRNGYSGNIDYQAFNTPNLQAFSGNSGTEYQATYVDLGQWTGKDIQIRFRLGSVAIPFDGAGWFIDDIEFMDLLAYNGEACVRTDEGDFSCVTAPEGGTIVESRWDPLETTDQDTGFPVRIFPNPASDYLTIALPDGQAHRLTVRLLTADGRLVLSKTVEGSDYLNLDTRKLPAGMYFVRIDSEAGPFAGKVILRK